MHTNVANMTALRRPLLWMMTWDILRIGFGSVDSNSTWNDGPLIYQVLMPYISTHQAQSRG